MQNLAEAGSCPDVPERLLGDDRIRPDLMGHVQIVEIVFVDEVGGTMTDNVRRRVRAHAVGSGGDGSGAAVSWHRSRVG